MEEYVTRREFLEFKKQVEQKTEEIKTVKVEVGSQDVTTRLDDLKQELKTVSDTWLETLQEHYTEHTARFNKLEESMAAMEERIIDTIRKYSQPGKN